MQGVLVAPGLCQVSPGTGKGRRLPIAGFPTWILDLVFGVTGMGAP